MYVYQILQQPKFSHVQRLCFREKMKLGKAGPKLRLACPNLEHLDFGYSDDKVHPSNDGLLEFLALGFPRLNSIAVDMWNLTAFGIQAACVSPHLGPNLQHLRMTTCTICGHYASGTCTSRPGNRRRLALGALTSEPLLRVCLIR